METYSGCEIKDCPVNPCRILAVDNFLRKVMQVRVVPYVGEFPRPKNSLQNSGHVGIQQWLRNPVAKQQHRVCNVLTNSR